MNILIIFLILISHNIHSYHTIEFKLVLYILVFTAEKYREIFVKFGAVDPTVKAAVY